MELPNPPRFWWLKRLSWLGLGMLIALAGMRWWWGYHADRLYAREMDRLRAAGRPAALGELASPAIPDDQNAAEFLRQAARLLDPNVESPRQSNLRYASYPPFPPEWWSAAEASYRASQPALQLVREARQHHRADWKRELVSPAINVRFPTLNPSRNVANVLADAALYEHFTGRDDLAIERLRDAIAQANALDEHPFLVAHLTSCGLHALTASNAMVIAPGLGMSDQERSTTQPVKHASKQQIQALISELLDERSQQQSLIRAVDGERVFLIDTAESSASAVKLLRPMLVMDVGRSMGFYDAQIRLADAPTWPAARRLWPGWATANGISRGLSLALRMGSPRWIEPNYRVRTERRLAAVSLAGQLFRIDHDRWPTTLAELVPDYLPTVPIDPMCPDSKPLRYVLAANGARPIVYSVGDDGAERPNPEAHLPWAPVYGWNDFRQQARTPQLDQYRDLSRFIADPAKSPKED